MRGSRLVFAVLLGSATSAGASTECSHATGDTPLVIGGTAVVCVVALVLWIASYVRRVHARDEAVAEPVSLLVAERLARAVQRRAGVLATVGVVGVPALVIMEAAPLAIVSTIIGCIGVRGFSIARAALQLIERGGPVTAEAFGPTIVVRGAIEEVELEVPIGALVRARRHGVPRSIAHRP